MPILEQRDRETVKQRFDIELKRDVNITLYTQLDIGLFIPGRECRSCNQTQTLVDEIAGLSPKLHLKVIDFYKNRRDASSVGVERIPAIIIDTSDKCSVRYFGLPTGYEFTLILDSIISASDQRSQLQLETRRQLKALKHDVFIQVFVTPN